jgi:predicted nucleotidyltransferase
MDPSRRWRELLDERLAEAVAELGRVQGVRGLIVGGSLGRGDPWPLSDIDLVPIYASSAGTPDPAAEAGRRHAPRLEPGLEVERRHAPPVDPAREVERRQALLVDWWAASGRAQTLDVGWLAFTDREVLEAVDSGPVEAAARMPDRRWLHGTDKAYGGRAAADPDGLAQAFVDWVNRVRFHPLVVAARARLWWRQALDARRDAGAALAGQDPASATSRLREAAGALRLALIEGWGERSSSMGRDWTRFERMADRRGRRDLAERLAALADADPQALARRADLAPAWLRERIDLAAGARRLIGEDVTPAQNARDQLLAFATHVARHRPDLAGPWMAGGPEPDLPTSLARLDQLMAEVARCLPKLNDTPAEGGG